MESPRYRRAPSVSIEWVDGALHAFLGSRSECLQVDWTLIGLLDRLNRWMAQEDLSSAAIAITEASLDRLVMLGLLERMPALPDEYRRDRPPPSSFKENGGGRRIAFGQAGALPVPLDEVLRRRRSIRQYAIAAPDLAVIGTLLYHAARVVSYQHDQALGDIVFHPYPGAGARSELELTLVANEVTGLSPGLYRYSPLSHDLVAQGSRDDDVAAFNAWACRSLGDVPRRPPALLIVTAVLERLTWKYGYFGRILVGQDLGCLYQTLYLVATALRLAPCAIGAPRRQETAALLGLDPFTEPPIGCFAIGVVELGDLNL